MANTEPEDFKRPAGFDTYRRVPVSEYRAYGLAAEIYSIICSGVGSLIVNDKRVTG